MVAQKSVMYQIISYMLRYPEEEQFWEGLSEIQSFLPSLADSAAKTWMVKAIEKWLQTDRTALRDAYVDAFDFRESTCLYLTAHEYGDSPDRGVALIELHQLFKSCGLTLETTELPDFLPGILEFLSAKPADFALPEGFEIRIARMSHRLLENLSDHSPYNDLFVSLLHLLPEVSYMDEKTAFPNRKDADLEELPYPMHYK